MGCGITQLALQHEHQVLVFDSSAEACESAVQSVAKRLERLNVKGRISKDKLNTALNTLHTTADLASFADCAFVIEAVVEDLAVKQDLFSRIEDEVSPTCILATNTSSLSVNEIFASKQTHRASNGNSFF